jgi:hypothetical protein
MASSWNVGELPKTYASRGAVAMSASRFFHCPVFRPGIGWRPSAAGEDSIARGGPTTHSLLTQIAGDTVLREATEDDHSSLLALEGTAPHAWAPPIQARGNFFARTDAYPVSQGAGYLTGLIKTFNAPSMRMVTALGCETAARFRPFAADLVDFNFVVKRLGNSPPVPPGPAYFDIRH